MKDNVKAGKIHGILLIALFSFAAFYISEFEFVKRLSLSPLIVGIVIGMLYANSLRNHLPDTWVPGIVFCTKFILRAGIVLYGFRLTFQQVVAVGLPAIVVDTIIVISTILLGYMAGKVLKMDKEMSLLVSIGSSICGAAAVLGAEPVVKGEPYKTAVAVSTVVVFGTLSMFIYPAAYNAGILDLQPEQMGIFTGATLHEVAHVAGAGNAMGNVVADVSIIVKMIRVLLLAPVLLVLGFILSGNRKTGMSGKQNKITVPWFAILFMLVIGFNSFGFLPETVIEGINKADTFMLTMAMTALGAETSFSKFRKAGGKPFVLAFLLYIWLLAGGYALVKYLAPLFVS